MKAVSLLPVALVSSPTRPTQSPNYVLLGIATTIRENIIFRLTDGNVGKYTEWKNVTDWAPAMGNLSVA